MDSKVKIRGPESVPGYPGNKGPTDIKKKKVRDEAELHVAHGQGPWGNLGRVDGQTRGEATNGENLWIKG